MKYFVLVFLSTLLAQSFGQDQVAAAVNQKLVLLGSNLRDDNDVVWKKLVTLAGGPGVAQFGVVSAVNLVTYKNAESAKVIANLLKAGAKSAVAIPVTKSGAFDGLVVNRIKNTTGIFIVEDTDQIGSTSTTTSTCSCINEFFYPAGVPSSSTVPPPGTVCYEKSAFNRKNLIDSLRPASLNDSFVLAAIRSVITKGGVVAGNAAVLGISPAILEGDPISSLVDDSRNFYTFPRTPFSTINRGLGLLNLSLIIESGLSENGREVRLMRALLESNIIRGIGIDENTALVVSDPFTAPIGEVIVPVGSTNGVLDMNVSSVAARSALLTGVYENVRFSFATVNDTINLRTGNITFAPFKVFIPGDYFPNATASDDILSLSKKGEWREAARYLIDSKDTNVTSYSPASLMPIRPAIKVFMDRNSSIGFGADMEDDPAKTYVASFSNMTATIKVLGITLPLP